MSAAPVYAQRARRRRPIVRRKKKSTQLASTVLASMFMFVATLALAYGLSTLVGCSMKEAAFRTALQAKSRAKAARSELARIQSKVQRIATLHSIGKWSKENTMVSNFDFKTTPVSSKKAVREQKTLVAKVDRGLQIDITMETRGRRAQAN